MCNYLNLPFGSEEFERLYESEAWNYIYLAYVEHRKREIKQQQFMMDAVMWIAGILSDTGTPVVQALTKNTLTESLAAKNLPEDWKERIEEVRQLERDYFRDVSNWPSYDGSHGVKIKENENRHTNNPM